MLECTILTLHLFVGRFWIPANYLSQTPLPVGFCQWETGTVDWKVEEREQTFFSSLWWSSWHGRWPSIFPAVAVIDGCWWLPASESYSENIRSDTIRNCRLLWPLVFSKVKDSRSIGSTGALSVKGPLPRGANSASSLWLLHSYQWFLQSLR